MLHLSSDFEYAEIPSTPPTVFQVVPSQSSNFGGVRVSVYMSNFKVVPSVAMLRVEVTLGAVSIVLDPADADSNMGMRSQMSQTMVSFTTPQFSVGGTASVFPERFQQTCLPPLLLCFSWKAFTLVYLMVAQALSNSPN